MNNSHHNNQAYTPIEPKVFAGNHSVCRAVVDDENGGERKGVRYNNKLAKEGFITYLIHSNPNSKHHLFENLMYKACS
jgi:hypothetical protein